MKTITLDDASYKNLIEGLAKLGRTVERVYYDPAYTDLSAASGLIHYALRCVDGSEPESITTHRSKALAKHYFELKRLMEAGTDMLTSYKAMMAELGAEEDGAVL